MLNKENSQVESGVLSDDKSPEMMGSSTSSQSISAMPPAPLPFPFRSAFTSPAIASGGACASTGQHNGTALNRFSSETLLRNQALLFDAYHGGNAGTGALSARTTFFNPSLFSSEGKQRYEESFAREADRAEKQSVDVTGVDGGERAQTASMFRSMYHSFTTSAAKSAARPAPANGSTKFSRRNLKRTLQDNNNVSNNKKAAISTKGKSSPKKVTKSNNNLPIMEVGSVQESSSKLNGNKSTCNLEVVVDGSSSSDEQKKTVEIEQNSSNSNSNSGQDAEILCDVEVGVESSVEACESSSKSTSSCSPNPSQCSSLLAGVSNGANGTITFHHLSETVSPGSSQQSPSNSSSGNQKPVVAAIHLVM